MAWQKKKKMMFKKDVPFEFHIMREINYLLNFHEKQSIKFSYICLY